jgi:carbon-monoxide dehydrogenase medium subunit
MLINLRAYHRPENIEQAVDLLRRGGQTTVALAGGTVLLPSGRRDVEAVVDLHGLPLSYLHVQGATLAIGATTTLQQLIESPELQTFSSGVLVTTARAVAARNIRNAATIGGTVAGADGGDPLLVTLLALDAQLTVFAPEARQIPIAGFLAYRGRLLDDGALIKEIRLPLLLGPLGAAYSAVGRTPSDRPIVCAVARMELASGTASNVRLALGGVAPVPVRANDAEQLLERKRLSWERVEAAAQAVVTRLAPPDHFLGGAEYRREMAIVLARRALRLASARAAALSALSDSMKEGGDENLADN